MDSQLFLLQDFFHSTRFFSCCKKKNILLRKKDFCGKNKNCLVSIEKKFLGIRKHLCG